MRGPREAAKTSLSPAIELGVDNPARLWSGDMTAAQLARSGIVHGSPGPVQEPSRLLVTAFGPVNLNGF